MTLAHIHPCYTSKMKFKIKYLVLQFKISQCTFLNVTTLMLIKSLGVVNAVTLIEVGYKAFKIQTK